MWQNRKKTLEKQEYIHNGITIPQILFLFRLFRMVLNARLSFRKTYINKYIIVT